MLEVLPVPWLKSGAGAGPEDGGCVMQVVDWISCNGWSDQPACVHPLIRACAINANDSMSDRSRQRLLDLIPRLMGTESNDPFIDFRLALFVNQKAQDWVRTDWSKPSPAQEILDAARA